MKPRTEENPRPNFYLSVHLVVIGLEKDFGVDLKIKSFAVSLLAFLMLAPSALAAPTGDSGLDLVNLGDARELGVTGSGMSIAFIDVGITSGHPYFGGRVVDGVCISSTFSCPNGSNYQEGVSAAEAPPDNFSVNIEDINHGNMVAGIAAGEINDFAPGGVAPDANIIMARNDARTDRGINAALEYFYQVKDQHNLQAVSISMGRLPTRSNMLDCSDDSQPMFQNVQRLVDAGVAVFAAAGNEQNPYGLLLPACLPNVISVGSVENNGDVANWTNSGEALDYFAPYYIRTADYAGYMQGSGTSASTPLVAASFLLAREVNPSVSINQFKVAIDASGVLTNDLLSDSTRIDIGGMLQAVASGSSSIPVANDGEKGPDDGEQSVWVKRISDTQVKFYAKYPQLNQKIQFMVQGDSGNYEEFAWTRIELSDLDTNGDYQNLTNDIYFVRTFNLETGKNRLRIYVNGEDAIGTKTYSR